MRPTYFAQKRGVYPLADYLPWCSWFFERGTKINHIYECALPFLSLFLFINNRGTGRNPRGCSIYAAESKAEKGNEREEQVEQILVLGVIDLTGPIRLPFSRRSIMTPLFGLSARSTNHKSLSGRRVFDSFLFFFFFLLFFLLLLLFFLSRFEYISVAPRGDLEFEKVEDEDSDRSGIRNDI